MAIQEKLGVPTCSGHQQDHHVSFSPLYSIDSCNGQLERIVLIRRITRDNFQLPLVWQITNSFKETLAALTLLCRALSN